MPFFPYWRLSSFYFFYFAFIGVFMPYFGLYLQSLSFSAWDIGVLMSQMQLMRLFGPYLWGTLSDRLGHRVHIVRLSGGITLLVFSGLFFVRSFEALLVVLALHSFFWVATLPLVETLTFEHLRDTPARYSRVRLWGSVGFVVAVFGTGSMLDYFPLVSLLWASVIVLAGIVLSSFLLPEAPVRPHAEESLPIGGILRKPKVKALLAACFLMTAAHGALHIFYSIFLTDHGYSKSVVGGLWSLGVLAEIVVFYFMSRVMQRFSLRAILLASFATAVVRFAMIGWGVDSLIIVLLAQLMHGLTFGAYHSASIAAVNLWFPGRTRSRGQALYASISFGAGGLLGGLLSGWTWDHIGAEMTFVLGSVYALLGLILVAIWIRGDDAGVGSAPRIGDVSGAS
ncbi:MAG: MFS transporter [Betaproteobacteria bacterium]